jgi:hypothetical protein
MPDNVEIRYTDDPSDPLPYVREKLYLAVTQMAESSELRLQKRLNDAYADNLVVLSPADFPDDLRPDFESIRDRMTNRSALWDEGTISATTAVMSEFDTKRLIADIVALFGDVCEVLGSQSTPDP